MYLYAVKTATLDHIQTILNSAGEEAQPIANARLEDYFQAAKGTIDPAEAITDFESQLADAAEAWQMADDESAEKRAAVLRVIASAMVLLAVDEAVRGDEACEKIGKRTDPLGFLKAKAVK